MHLKLPTLNYTKLRAVCRDMIEVFKIAHDLYNSDARTHAHARAFNGPLSGTTRVSQYQKGKTNPAFY